MTISMDERRPGEHDDSSVDRVLGTRAGSARVTVDDQVGVRRPPGAKGPGSQTKPTQGAENRYPWGYTTFLDITACLHTFAPSSAVVDRDAWAPPMRLGPFSGLRPTSPGLNSGRFAGADAVISGRWCPLRASPALPD